MAPRAIISIAAGASLLTALTLGAMLRGSAPEATRTHQVVIEGMKFSPAELRINPGDRVVFQNRDLLPHTATAKDSGTFDSGLIKAGESWSIQVAGLPQTIRYLCLYHPTMEGRLIVEQP